MADPLPTASEAFGIPAPKTPPLPSAAEAFGPAVPPLSTGAGEGGAYGGADMDAFFGEGSVGAILDKFGQGFKQGWGAKPLGLDPDTDKWLDKHAPDYGVIGRAFHDEIVRPAAIALDAALRAPGALIRGVSEPLVYAGVPPELTPEAAFEAFPAGHGTALPMNVPTPQAFARAADLGVIGKGEAGYQDLPTAAATEALRPTGIPSATERVVAPPARETAAVPETTPAEVAAPEAPAEAPVPDIHAAARELAPDTFAEYDALAARKDTFHRWLGELADSRANSDQATTLQGRVDDILGKVGGVESRLTKAAAQRLDAARSDLDSFLRTDTPDMARVRQDLQKTDFAMRDLAPDVSAAYRQAAERVPPAEEAPEVAPAATEPAPETVAAPAGAPAEAPKAPPATTVAAPTEEPPPAPASAAAEPISPSPEPVAPPTPAEPIPGGIAGDVSRQLVAAGRPAEEANAAAALVEAHYEARAANLKGAAAEDLYRSDAPRVVAGRGVKPAAAAAEPVLEPAQGTAVRRGKIRLATDDARATITLFKNADASTFIHETGHHWLEELIADAGDTRATDAVREDAATVRQWLGADEGKPIPTRAHEKFARGFERYMMEGHAPSTKLAGVFAKFRDWLTTIYQTVAGLRSPINDDIRGVFDRMLATKEEPPVIAPERPTVIEASAPGRELGPTAVPKNRSAIYEPVPKEPRRLVDFLRREGGIKDERGEISHILGGKNQRPGLINGKGKSLDEAALRAWEEGYFPDHGDNRPTINDLLDAIREDVSGNARYSFHDDAMADAFRGALGRNAEIDRLADRMGVNPHHYTREQFFDMAAEHMSLEERAREIGSLDADSERQLTEAENRAREALGDAWEPDEVYAGADALSLEELERAHEHERAAAANPRQGEGGAVAPAPAAGGEGTLQEGARQGGRGAGAPGGGSEAPSEAAGPQRNTVAPDGPNRQFEPLDDGRVDKAGNIRLDNLSQPDDIDAVIREAAERNGDYLPERRGVITDGQMLDLADALGKDPAFLDEKKIGAAFSAEEILAARKLLIQSATAVRDAMARASSGADADIAALAKSIARHEMIQGKVAQATAEWGRAGRAFRALDGWEGARDLNQFLKDNTGRDLNQLRQMAQFGKSLGTPGEVSKFVADTAGGKVRQAIIYYWVNTLISGPITHLTYSVGNAINALWTPLVETPLAATSGRIREALGVAAADRVYFNEASAQLYGLGKGFREGLAAAGQAFRYGVSPLLPGERVPARMIDASLNNPLRQVGIPRPIAEAVGVPGRAVSAIHSFFKSLRYEQNIQALAMRDALNRGLEGNARDLHITRLTERPTEEMMASAVADALKELYMRPQPYNSPGAYLTRATNSWLPAKIVAPFVKIGSEIVRNAFVERTPLGLGSADVRGNLLGREGGAALDMQLGKIMAGTGLIAATVLGVIEGNITGDGPSDPNERRTWLLSRQPNHVTIGPLTFSYARLGHLGMLTRFAANMTETADRWRDEDGPHLAKGFFDGIARSVLDETWMRGVKDVFDAIYHPEEYFDRWVARFAAQWTPFSIGLGQVARAVDPYQRETRDVSTLNEIFNEFRGHTPWLSQSLPPRRDVFGEPITTGSGTVDRYATDKVALALSELHIGIAMPQRKIRGVELTPQQYDDYSRMGGRLAKMELDAIVGPAFHTLPPETQIKILKETVSHAHESAAAQVMMQSVGSANDIIAKATDSKAAALQGASHLDVKEKLRAR